MSTKSKLRKQKVKTEVVKSYKGFDSNMQCRGFQFKVGETFTHDGPVAACEQGFHACEYPLDVLRYYAPAESQYAEVEQTGTIVRHADDSKVASSVIRIKASITLPALIQAAVDFTFARSNPEGEKATGDRGAASATGDSGAASATGKFGRAMGGDGCALFLVERDDNWNIIAVGSAIVGKTKGIKANVWYTLTDGKFVEVK